MRRIRLSVLLLAAALVAAPAAGVVPEYSAEANRLALAGVSPDNPVIYDNDFWTDVPDAAYVWAKASLGHCNLRGNVITRCTFGWEKKYAHELDQQVREAGTLLKLARASGMRNIPEPVVGAREALRRPTSGRIDDTQFARTAGSELIVAEARKASTGKPLLVFVGGSYTTVAAAVLSDPSIADRVVVFQIDGGGYNGSDGWAWEIAMNRCRFANWARGYFWNDVSTWDAKCFDALPANPLCDWLREYATKGLGKANQWGDGPWLYWLYDPQCLRGAEPWDARAITVPKSKTDVPAMAAEFVRTLSDSKAYGQPGQEPRRAPGESKSDN
jgi:hypothetical protein